MIVPIDGDTRTFTAIAYGMPDPLTIQWCEQRAMESRQMLLPEVQTFFENKVNTVFDAIDYESITRTAKALAARVDSFWNTDIVCSITDLQSLQNAPPVMMNWIMSHPFIREMYHNQEIAGYDEYYVDPDPGNHDGDYYKYREVINGVYIENDDGDVTSHYWPGEFDDSILDLSDQANIIETWNACIAYLRAGRDDPTSTYGAML